ncbi:MAG TPA: hypothetical protein VLX91_04395 [Candidatus Acidoferrales bacterium]|nr:hypothetical protein [Candidatus Acidoferrales bacterium]
MSSILLVAIAPVDVSVLSPLTESIGKTFEARVDVIQSPPLDGSFAFNLSRNQYNSTSILSALLEKSAEWIRPADFSNGPPSVPAERDFTRMRSGGKILGVTDGDIFVPVLTYVFGEAQFDGKAAVVSSHRLREEFYGLQPDKIVFMSRLAKEAIHELGHTFGLIHCGNYLCVMHSSTGVEEVDVKTDRFCDECRKKLIAHGW